jgi:hypothetical protein
MIKGSCLCGGVRYCINGNIGDITHCHCTTCRKAHGAVFSSVASVQIDDFKITTGENLLGRYHSSPDKVRVFCSNCGSQLYAHREGQQHYFLRLGSLDDDPNVRPANPIWLSQKAPWYDIKTDYELPQYEEWAEPR